jgi:glyoxylase-like metal-dependent hydrolase (beta-lactamase superfamily II)
VVTDRRDLPGAVEFWSSPTAGRAGFAHLLDADDLATIHRLVDDGRVEILDGDATVAPGVSLHLVGGHTPGMQVVRVETDDRVVVLASDASHFYANLEEDKPYGVVCDLPDMYRAFDRLRDLAGAGGDVVPGHDPRVTERYRAVPGTDDLVHDLTAALPLPLSEGPPPV